MDNFVRYAAESEKLFVRDNDGYVEVSSDMEPYLFGNPDIYELENACLVDNTMCYFFVLKP